MAITVTFTEGEVNELIDLLGYSHNRFGLEAQEKMESARIRLIVAANSDEVNAIMARQLNPGA